MNREERRQLAMRVRRGIASERDVLLFGRMGKARGQSGWHPHKAIVAALRAMPIPPDRGTWEFTAYRREKNARKRERRALRDSTRPTSKRRTRAACRAFFAGGGGHGQPGVGAGAS